MELLAKSFTRTSDISREQIDIVNGDSKNTDNKTLNKAKVSAQNPVMLLYTQFTEAYRLGSWGYGAISILGQSCFASIAAMLLFVNGSDFSRPVQMAELFLVTIFCMGFNASVLAQQKDKIQVNMLIASVLVSLIVICINLF